MILLRFPMKARCKDGAQMSGCWAKHGRRGRLGAGTEAYFVLMKVGLSCLHDFLLTQQVLLFMTFGSSPPDSFCNPYWKLLKSLSSL